VNSFIYMFSGTKGWCFFGFCGEMPEVPIGSPLTIENA
jgi:hypothetical protein